MLNQLAADGGQYNHSAAAAAVAEVIAQDTVIDLGSSTLSTASSSSSYLHHLRQHQPASSSSSSPAKVADVIQNQLFSLNSNNSMTNVSTTTPTPTATATLNQCGYYQQQQQYPYEFNGDKLILSSELSVNSSQLQQQQQQQQQQQLQQGFCGPTTIGNHNTMMNESMMMMNGVTELGFNPMDYNFSDIEPLWIQKQWPDILMRVSFVAPVVLLGIVGNLTIIWSICKFKSFRSKPTNIFILSMAIADLITALVCPLAALFTDIYQFYVLGSVLCRLEGSIKITCLLVSAYSLNWLSFIWLRYIVQPCRTRISIKQSWIILVGIWMASILMASPLFCWRMLRSRQWRDLNEIWCCELIHISKYYWVVITFIIVYLPTFFMTIILVIILIQMDKFEAKLRRSITTTTTTTTTTNTHSNGNQTSNNTLAINMKYRRRIVKVLLSYLGISIVCWAPFQFSIIYRHFRREACLPPGYSDFVFASQLLASVPGALNPFVFGFLSQPFRKIVGTFWMFRFLDKLLIWRSKPNSDNHQMEVKIVAKTNSSRPKQQNQQPAVNHHKQYQDQHHHRHHHHQHHQQHHHHQQQQQQQQQRPHTTTTRSQSIKSTALAGRSSQIGQQKPTKQKQQHRNQSSSRIQSSVTAKQTITVDKGCENAAYESTVGD